ncbi:hypothetical protein Pan153_10030 [Gimesia panareensis]|uniref:Uncharacterized protein n=1 Tax=Gimesia panareensis TaxID=2527978 RepID=A0A518FJ57_9PLAN|nr:hypothetical protein [Gimesia panareensis]QDV16376.1 hypothetical protein Pan153_10030 [Gimesia panareensis]
MSIVVDSLRGMAELFKYAFRTFALTLVVVDGFYGLLLLWVVFWISVAGTSSLRFVLATIVTVSFVMVLGITVAFQFTMARTIAWGVAQAALGRRVFDALFDRVLGVSDGCPEGRYAVSQAVHGVSLAELEAKLKAAGEMLLTQNIIAANVPRALVWFARLIQRALIWATVRVILRYCLSCTDETEIDLLDLRQRLSTGIDKRIAEHLKYHALRMIVVVFSVVTFLAILMALGIRCVP